jgi:hypothetical protein
MAPTPYGWCRCLKETLSINDRGQIGNLCYLTKQKCDSALVALKASGGY